MEGVLPRDLRTEQEIKRARGALSCAECRRLKVRCDKKIPCSACQRRGCASICPNGSLTTGQGTRFVLADTERLHRKMAEMSDRIRQLEEALSDLQSRISSDRHHLLRTELLSIKTLQELHINPDIPPKSRESNTTSSSSTDFIDAFGTLAVRDDGASKFYGRSAGSESLLLEEVEPAPESFYSATLPDDIMRFSEAFPFHAEDVPASKMQGLLETFLPPWQRAWELCHLYLEQAPWFFGPLTREQLMEELFCDVYNSQASSSSAPESPNASRSGSFTSHDLALLFIVFAIGALTDLKLPMAPDNAEAEHYYQLTRAALTLEPVLDRAPSVTTVQTLSLMAIYQGMALKENSIESTWAFMGLATKLAQSIGLHRDSARWKLEPREVQKRRALFWELFITDSWQSLATGRPPSFTLQYVDCELPQDLEQTMDSDGSIQPSFPAWKARFGAECVTAVVEGTLTARSPKYANILDLDRKIRDLPLPKYAETKPNGAHGLAHTMKHYMPINYRGFILVYLHRSFFAQALYDHPIDPIRSQYAPSFLAAYESASSVLGALREQFELFPEGIARFWPLWTHAFSSAVIIGSVVTRAPRSKVAPAAMEELNTARNLFEKAIPYGGRAIKILPILVRLHEKAKASFVTVHQYNPGLKLPALRLGDNDEEQDELSVFGGRTRLVATRQLPQPLTSQTHQTPPTYASSSSSPYTPSTASMASYTPSTVSMSQHPLPPPASFTNVHPHLVDQLYGFQDRVITHVGSPAGHVLAQPTWEDVDRSGTHMNPMIAAVSAPPSYAQDAHHVHPGRSVSHLRRAGSSSELTQHAGQPRKSGSLQETWSALMQQLEVPTPPTYDPR